MSADVEYLRGKLQTARAYARAVKTAPMFQKAEAAEVALEHCFELFDDLIDQVATLRRDLEASNHAEMLQQEGRL